MTMTSTSDDTAGERGLRITRNGDGDVVELVIADPCTRKAGKRHLLHFGAANASTLASVDLAGLAAFGEADLARCVGWMGHLPRLAVPHGLSAEGLQPASKLRGLESLDLSTLPGSTRPSSWFPAVPWIRELVLGPAAGDKDLVAAAGLERLHRLEIVCNEQITAAGFRALARSSSLRDLVIWLSDMSAEGLAALAAARLESLSIVGGTLSAEDFGCFADGALARLDLPNTLHDRAGLAVLCRVAPATGRLSLAGWDLRDEDLERLAAFSRLEELDLADCSWLGDAGLAHVGRVATLRRLDLGGCPRLTSPGLAALRGLALDALGLPPLALDEDGLAAVVACCRQTRDSLEVTTPGGSAATVMQAISAWQPERVVLRGRQFDDTVLPALAADARLRRLDLAGTSVTLDGIAALAGRNLDTLDLPVALRTDAGLAAWLAAIGPREHFDFTDWTLTAAGIAALPATGPGGRPIRSIAMPATARDDDGLAAWLERVRPGASLDLRGWRITDASLSRLAARPSIRSLDLRQTNVTAAAPEAFRDRKMRAFQLSPRLLTPRARIRLRLLLGRRGTLRLKLGTEGLAPEEVRLLAECRVPSLMLSTVGPLSREALAAFREEAERFRSIESLTVRSAAIGDGAIDLVEALPSVRRLDLSRANVTAVALRRLRGRLFERLVVPPALRGPHGSVRAFVEDLADPPGTVTNAIGMLLVPIAPGTFQMGSPDARGEEWCHTVTLTRPFLMGMHAVTQAQYERVMGANPSTTRGPDHPVDHVPWADAVVFCERLSALPEELAAGRSYRLPTEAEWEYGCRAGTTTRWNVGDRLPRHLARFSSRPGWARVPTVPVGTYPPNAWGLHEMHGNVWEWTGDWFDSEGYQKSRRINPFGPPAGTHHTARGGSASVADHECTSAIRGEAFGDVLGPASRGRYGHLGDFGLRVVCETPPVEGLPTQTHRALDRHLAAGEAGEVVLGLSLLRASGATAADCSEALSRPVLKWIVKHALLDGVRPEILEPLLECLRGHATIEEELEVMIACRFAGITTEARRRTIIEGSAERPSLAWLHDLLVRQPAPPALALHRLTTLSPASARRLGRHKGPVLIEGAVSIGDEARAILASAANVTLATPQPRLDDDQADDPSVAETVQETSRGIDPARDRPTPVAGPRALTGDQIPKIRGLLESERADGVTLGLSLLESLGATPADYEAVLTDKVKSAVARIAHEWVEGGEATRAEYVRYHGLLVRPAFLATWGGASASAKPFIDLVDIPAGSFTMGSPESEYGRRDDENQVPVRITKPFAIGRTVVTQGQWRAVMGTEPWRHEGLEDDQCGDDFPAVCVSWDDAVLFCETLTGLERETGRLTASQAYRLPTEAEWEYACRAGTTTAYSFGDDEEQLYEYGWFDERSDPSPYPVAQKKPNPWGLFDMHGNVCEWCADWYGDTLAGGDDPQGPAAGSFRVFRGGHWCGVASGCRSACRFYDDPWGRGDGGAFRVVVLC